MVLLALLKGLKCIITAANDEKLPTADIGPHLDTLHVKQTITHAWENVCADDEQCTIICGTLIEEDELVDYGRDSHKHIQVVEEFAECLWMVNFKPDLSQVRKYEIHV